MVSVFDSGFLYGDGLFETFRAYSGKIFALQKHLDRLAISSKQLQLSLPPDSILKKRLNETLERNHLKEAILRLTITRGTCPAGFRPDLCGKTTLVISARPVQYFPDQYRKGVSCIILGIKRTSPTGIEPFPKSLNFLNNVLGKLEVHRRKAFEGIFLNKKNQLTEGTISNLFWVKGDILFTPSESATILKGITRNIVIDLTKKIGLRVAEGRYPQEDLFNSDEAFLTSTGIALMPITSMEGHPIGSGQPGRITQTLHKLFQESTLAL
ncbi:MAG: aminotransferase class IV [Nitrospiria bacterium]